MQKYIIHRLLELLPTLFLASILIFLIIVLAPGDPALMMAGSDSTAEDIEYQRERMGLNRPLPVRYGIWLSDVVKLNLGYSLYTKRPVVQVLRDAFPQSMKLAILSLFVAMLVGFPFGMLAALKQNSRIDAIITGVSSVGLAIPPFWLGIVMILFFSVRMRILPPSGVGDPDQGGLDNLRYLIMPVATIAFSNASVFCRFLRSAMIDVLSADYVRTAWAKGLGGRAVLTNHALKNAMIPVVTIIGIQFGRLLGGAVIVESVFAYSGLGRLSVLSILNRDYPVVQGVLMLVVLIFLLVNLAVDLAYGYLDPRIKFERAR